MTARETIVHAALGFTAGVFAAKAYLEGVPEWYLAAVAFILIGVVS